MPLSKTLAFLKFFFLNQSRSWLALAANEFCKWPGKQKDYPDRLKRAHDNAGTAISKFESQARYLKIA